MLEVAQHFQGADERLVVVLDRLQLGDMADRPQRGLAELAHPFGQRVDHGVDLVAVLVEQQVIVAEMRPAHVPVEVLGLEVEGEGVGGEAVQAPRQSP